MFVGAGLASTAITPPYRNPKAHHVFHQYVVRALRRDELISTSLRRLYLDPLEAGRDGGETTRETLRAWFRCERNISSTAAALGVDRRTVRNRLRVVEAQVGRPLAEVALDLELALRLDP